MTKAMVAMSGGVDSSVAAFLMKESGYDCIGVTMKLFGNEDICIDGESSCCSLSDVEDARSVAHKIGIPHYVFNFSGNFRECVIDKFVNTYLQGGTPNPCIDCNRYLKFDKLYLRARELSCDCVATGHYARISYDSSLGKYMLQKALDESKDQSYVLFSLTQEQLAHTVFPLGALLKSEVREVAEYNSFINAKKGDSQDICFVPNGDYAAFIERYSGKKIEGGRFIDENGNTIGRHRGIIHYTIGQRRGLGLALPAPLYVSKKDPLTNTVTLTDNTGLFSKQLNAGEINLIPFEKITSPLRCRAKIRYKQPEQLATVWQTADDRIHVEFDQPQRAVAAGQAVVLYDGETVIGGGTILGEQEK